MTIDIGFSENATRRSVSSTRMSAAALAGMLSFTVAACSDSSSAHPSASSSKSAAHAATFHGKTACTSVMYVGESTSLGMVVSQQIPKADERLEARMKAVGVTRLGVNISGGRSTIERFENRPNAMDVLTESFAKSFKGCYFIALGVNDAANSSFAHSAGTARQRIELILNRTGNRPVLWPLARTSPNLGGPYANHNMTIFNNELKAAAKRHPNVRLYDWPAEMNPTWWEGDGIHDKRIGSRERAEMYANALAVAFPAGMKANPATIVGSQWAKPASQANIPTLPAMAQDNQSFWAADQQALKLYTSGPKNP